MTRWKRLAAALLVVSALVATATADAGSWRLVRSKTSHGQYTLTTASKYEIRRPRALAVRFGGGDVSGSALVTCSRGWNVASWTRSFSDSRLHRLPMMRGAETCDVVASVTGEGYASVRIYKQ
jgi:hypothetical protein